MSRPRKFKDNEVVLLRGGDHAAVVGYRHSRWGRYLVVRCDAIGRYPYGPPIWADSSQMEATGKISRRPGIVARANARLGGSEERGCLCMCCDHVKGTADEPKQD